MGQVVSKRKSSTTGRRQTGTIDQAALQEALSNVAKTKRDGEPTTSPGRPSVSRTKPKASAIRAVVTGVLAAGRQDVAMNSLNKFIKSKPPHYTYEGQLQTLDQWRAEAADWVEQIAHDPEAGTKAAGSPAFFARLIELAEDLNRSSVGPERVTQDPDGWLAWILEGIGAGLPAGELSTARRQIAATLLDRNWADTNQLGPVVLGWMIDALGDEIRTAGKGLAPRLINRLWNAGTDEAITTLVKLIEEGRVDTDTSYTTGTTFFSTGKPKVEPEGVYSGFVQPLEHLLGKYLRPAGMPQNPGATPNEKVKRAARLLAVLEKRENTRILTQYAQVVSSELVTTFEREPGTIWGFEGIRHPYVEAAHATAAGKRPIRMMEIWEAIGPMLNQTKYEQMFEHPDTVIAELVKDGLSTVERSARPEYARSPEFKAAFIQQATSYLEHLASQRPKAKFATAEQRGHLIGKYPATMACKAGLWWAKEKKEPVYYCLDGVNLDDVISYKTLKTAALNTFVDAADPLKSGLRYTDIVTLAEIREILTNWDDLKETVRFVRKGKILKGPELDEIVQFKAAMETADKKVENLRKAPDSLTFSPRLIDLGLDLPAIIPDRHALQIVAQGELVRIAAGSHHPLLYASLTSDESKVLFEYGVLPEGFATDYGKLLSPNPNTPEVRNNLGAHMRKTYESKLPEALKTTLLAAIDKAVQSETP